MKYGKDFIRHLFEKRTESKPVRVVLESKVQADSGRRDIKHYKMTFKELANKRFSCRKYSDEPVKKEDIEYIMGYVK